MNNPDAEPLRIVFMGTAELACASLAALLAAPYAEVVAVVTQPDKPRGRDLKLQPSPVKELALRHRLAVLQPSRARDPGFIEQLRALHPDLIVVTAYGQILPPAVLDLPRHGCLNVHTSLLPKYRGASPIQTALLHGDAETGVTIMQMDVGMDTGPILSAESISILPADNAATLHDRLAEVGAALLTRTIPEYIAGRIVPQPQPMEGSSYAKKITREDGRVDWTMSAASLHLRLRAFTPWPGLFTVLRVGTKPGLLKIWEATPVGEAGAEPGTVIRADKNGIVISCGVGSLCVTRLQLEGGKRLTAETFLAGHNLKPGMKLGD